jgi:hypothetical protein
MDGVALPSLIVTCRFISIANAVALYAGVTWITIAIIS